MSMVPLYTGNNRVLTADAKHMFASLFLPELPACNIPTLAGPESRAGERR